MTQTIYRPARRHSYTVISNALMNDERLSADALGILVYLLSRPDDWVIHREQLMRRFAIGRDKFQAIFRELSGAGYARLESIAGADAGQLAGKRWVIIEEPEAESRQPENPVVGAATEERVSRRSVEPTVGKPVQLISTDSRPITETTPKTESPQPPKGAREGEGLGDELETESPRTVPDAWSRFEAAWPWQPGGESRKAARRALARLSAAEQILCAKAAEAFQPPKGGRICAAVFIGERQWAFSGRKPAIATQPHASGDAVRRPDGSWFLKPGSRQLQAWNEHERRTGDGKAKAGCTRPSEWPPGHAERAA